jgi:pimeloyl-ACP methyl ester carboxylesterase
MERLKEISCPALVVVGEHDVLDIKKIVELLSKKIHNSQTYEIKGAAHTLNMEKPKEFNELVIEFLKKK